MNGKMKNLLNYKIEHQKIIHGNLDQKQNMHKKELQMEKYLNMLISHGKEYYVNGVQHGGLVHHPPHLLIT